MEMAALAAEQFAPAAEWWWPASSPAFDSADTLVFALHVSQCF